MTEFGVPVPGPEETLWASVLRQLIIGVPRSFREETARVLRNWKESFSNLCGKIKEGEGDLPGHMNRPLPEGDFWGAWGGLKDLLWVLPFFGVPHGRSGGLGERKGGGWGRVG